MKEAIKKQCEEHYKKLSAIFPTLKGQDALSVCRKLRRYEAKLHKFAEKGCIEGLTEEDEKEIDRIEAEVKDFLRDNRDILHFNYDPRGYAIKIKSDIMHIWEYNLTRDGGGFGIIAPEFEGEEE